MNLKAFSWFYPHIVSLTTVTLLIVVLFWRVLFLGETFIDLAAHENQLPWGHELSAYEDYSFNRRDLTDTYVTRDYFLVDSYSRGELPLWNPLIMVGHPIYADGVTRLFAVTNLFYLYFDVPLGYSLARIAELFLTAIFFYIFLIQLRLGVKASLTGTLVLIVSDHILHHLTWLGWLGGLMWLPLVLTFADRAINSKRITPSLWAGIFLALQFYNGFIPITVYFLAVVAAYYLLAPFLVTGERRLSVLKMPLLQLIITLLVGFGLSAVVWMPISELLSFSNRKIVPTELDYIWLPPWHLLTILFPRSYGEAFEPKYLKMFVEMGVSQDRSIYLGIATLTLLPAALWKVKDRKVYLFAFLLVAAIVVATCPPIYVHITKYLPVLKTIRAITRVSIVYTFAGAVLAAYGMEKILELSKEDLLSFLKTGQKLYSVFLLTILLAVAVFTLVARFIPQDFDNGNRLRRWSLKIVLPLVDQFHFSLKNFDLLVPLSIVTTLIIIFWYCRSYFTNSTKGILFYLLTTVMSCELLWHTSQYNPTFQSDLVYRKTSTTEFLRENLKNYRVLVAPAEFSSKAGAKKGKEIIAPPNTLVPYKIATISGKNQLYPKWYREFTSCIEEQKELSHIVFDKTSSPFYKLLGVKFLMTREGYKIEDRDYQRAYNGEGVAVYENIGVMTRAFFAKDVLVSTDSEHSLKLMKSSNFDPTKQVVVEMQSSIKIDPIDQNDRVEVKEYKNNQVLVETSSSGRRLLVLTDMYYPGWKVEIDGVSSELLRADRALRAVIVESGRHSIKFLFWPTPFVRGIIVSITTLLLTLFLLIWTIKKER